MSSSASSEAIDSSATNTSQRHEKSGVLVGLANLPPKALVDEYALAGAFCVTPRTIRRMIARHELPPPIRVAGRSQWLVDRVLSHLDARAERAAREAEREEARLGELLRNPGRGKSPIKVEGKEAAGGEVEGRPKS